MTQPLPPGSTGLPLVGETLAFLKDSFAFFDERYKKHGKVFRTNVFGGPMLCFVGPEAFSFFADEGAFTRKNSSPPHLRELFDPGAIPFLDGADHTRRRNLLLHAFTPAALDDAQPTLERVIHRFLARWEDGQERRGVDELGLLAFAVCDALFTGSDPDRDEPELVALFLALSAGVTALPVKLPFTPYGRAVGARDRLRTRLRENIAAYRAGTGRHLLEHLVRARDASGVALSPEELEIEILHFLFAAVGGLQTAMVHILLRLTEHPDVRERVRSLVRAKAATGPLGLAWPELGYLHQVTKEARRLALIVPMTFFATVRKDTSFGGFRIPGGWKAVGVVHATMKDAKTFPSPDRFDPDRFAPTAAIPNNAYVAHGGGPMSGHRCAGEALADRVLATFLGLVARDHTWELPAQDLSLHGTGLAPLPRDGLRIRFQRG